MEPGWKTEIMKYYNKLTLRFLRMQVEYCTEKAARKNKKLNGITKVRNPIRQIIYSSMSDEGEESSEEENSVNVNKKDRSLIGSDEDATDADADVKEDGSSSSSSSSSSCEDNETNADNKEKKSSEDGKEKMEVSDETEEEASEKDKGENEVSESDKEKMEVSDETEKEASEKGKGKKEVGESDKEETEVGKYPVEEMVKNGNEVTENATEEHETSKDNNEDEDSDNAFTDKVNSIAKKPVSLLEEIKKDLLSDIRKDLLEGTRDDSRSNEDNINTERFLNNLEESLISKGNIEDLDMFDEDSKKSSRSEAGTAKTVSGVASQDMFAEEENINKDESSSNDSHTLTADSKTLIADCQSQSLLTCKNVSKHDKKYLEALEMKRNVLASSDESDDDEEKSSDSDDPGGDTVKKRILESSDSDASSESESNSDANSKVESRKSKKAVDENGQNTRRKSSSSDGSSTNEEKELDKLTNLNNLKRRRLNFESEDDKEEEVEERRTDKPKKSERKHKDAVDSLTDFYGGDVSSGIEEEDRADPEEDRGDPLKTLWKETVPVVKSVVLASSDSSSEATDEEEKVEVKIEDKKKETDKKKYDQKKRPSWLNDPLLRNEISSSEDERRWKEKRKRVESSPEVLVISSDDSDNFRPTNTQKKKKRKIKPSEYVDSDVSSTESEVENVSPVKSQDTPSKGRKNIKKILKKDSLMLETRQALNAETERKKRLEERKKIYEKLFPEKENQLVLDFDPESKKPLLKVDEKLVSKLKPHQKEGVKFMWDCCFESLKRLEEDSGSGCILAHCMGLGKTLQAIALVHTLLINDTGVQTVLIICPLNTVHNWQNEFKIWLRNVKGKHIRVYGVNQYNKHFQRSEELQYWQREGGVMIISYEMFRILSSDLKKSPQKKHVPYYEKALLDPGPDLVICDEGHKIKNIETSLSKSIRKIKTLRRVILTGTPLQNNLREYYWMVNFIKPNILGNKTEFMNRFDNPIKNGQYKDSTALDVKIMQKRVHVLHSLLDGCIQRFNYDIASPFLPDKQEYVISVLLTPTQAKLYEFYLQNYSKKNVEKVTTAGLFKDFHSLQRVYTHPFALRAYARRPHNQETNPEISLEGTVPTDWWKNMIPEEEFEAPGASGKISLLFSVLEECKKIGDKVLVFSQSLFALELIEFFLKKFNEEGVEPWIENLDYFKLTGATPIKNRTKACRTFNKIENVRGRLFLISTKAGGLGINLIAANRVILFDASWNPSHDVQSIFRVYRFGQKKTCYIYRFLAEGTMEEKIYERQITKLSLSDRVVDEHQIERHYTMGNMSELYTYEPIPPDKWETPNVPKDALFATILKNHKDIIVGYHEHDSLLENKEEEELTEEERKAAWEEFEKEKFSYGNKAIPSPLKTSNAEVLATNDGYAAGVLNMMEVFKNSVGGNPPSGSSTVVNPYAQTSSSASVPNSSSPSASSALLNMALARSSSPNAARSDSNDRRPKASAEVPSTPSGNTSSANNSSPGIRISNVESLKKTPSNQETINNVMKIGKLLGLYPYNGEKMRNFWLRINQRLDELKIPTSVIREALRD